MFVYYVHKATLLFSRCCLLHSRKAFYFLSRISRSKLLWQRFVCVVACSEVHGHRHVLSLIKMQRILCRFCLRSVSDTASASSTEKHLHVWIARTQGPNAQLLICLLHGKLWIASRLRDYSLFWLAPRRDCFVHYRWSAATNEM